MGVRGKYDALKRHFKHVSNKADQQFDHEKWVKSYAQFITPSRIEVCDTHLLIDHRIYIRCLVVGLEGPNGEGYPRGMSSKTIERLQELSFNNCKIMLSHGLMQITDNKAKSNLQNANEEVIKEQLHNKKDGKAEDLELSCKKQDIVSNYRQIYFNSQKSFNSSFIIVITGSEKDVFNAESYIITMLKSDSIDVQLCDGLQLEMFLSALPFPVSDSKAWVHVRSDTAAMLCTATNLNSRTDETGLYFGKDLKTNKDVFINLDKLPAKHLTFLGATGAGKLLPLDTKLPTPTGWTTMGDIKQNDALFDENGNVCYVTEVFNIEEKPVLYRFTFDDGSTIDSCKDHLWVTYNAHERSCLHKYTDEFRKTRNAKRFPNSANENRGKHKRVCKPLPTGTIRSTQEIVDTLYVYKCNRANHAIKVTSSLELPDIELPIDPYLLGLWLGNGTSVTGAITTADEELTTNWIKIPSSKYGWRVPGLTVKLKEANLIHNKHIPEIYMRASKAQRLALLQGLMDSDGTIKKGSGTVTFDNTNEKLMDATIELVCSLGFKPGKKTSTIPKLNGKECKRCFSIMWTPNEYVFRLARKKNLQTLKTRSTNQFRYITKAERIESRPGRCIRVSSPNHMYLAGERMVPTHNTYSMMLLLMRMHDMLNYRIIYVTPKADYETDYKAVAKYYGKKACVVDIGDTGSNINPLQILIDKQNMGDNIYYYTRAYNRHKDLFIKFYKVWLPSLSDNADSYIDETLDEVYEQAGIIRDQPETWERPWPVMQNIYNIWKRDSENYDLGSKQKTAEALVNKSYQITGKGILSYLNRPTTDLDLSKDFIIVDMSKVPETIKDAMNVLVTGMLNSRFSPDNTRDTIIAIDEGGVYLRNPYLSTDMLTRLTQGRSNRVYQWIGTHQPSDFTKNGVREEYQTNMFCNIILGANISNAINDVGNYFLLTEDEKATLLECGNDDGDNGSAIKGQGLLIINGQKIPIRFEPTELENAILKGKYVEKNTCANPATDCGIGECKIKPEYQWLVDDQKIILTDWTLGDASNLITQGYEKHRVSRLGESGTQMVYFPIGYVNDRLVNIPHIGKMTVDHYCTVVQLAALGQEYNADEILINHNQDVDVELKFGRLTVGLEVERAGSHTVDELVKKKEAAIEKYDMVKFICSATDAKIISKAVGEDYVVQKGSSVREFLQTLSEGTADVEADTPIQANE